MTVPTYQKYLVKTSESRISGDEVQESVGLKAPQAVLNPSQKTLRSFGVDHVLSPELSHLRLDDHPVLLMDKL
jgi:hypothetical protein